MYVCIQHIYQCFSDGIVSLLEVVEKFLHDGLGVGVVTHRIEKVDCSLTNTDITLSLGRQCVVCVCVCVCVRERERERERGKGSHRLSYSLTLSCSSTVS